MPVAFVPGIGDGRRIMRRILHPALILCLVLTGIGLGAARGTVVMDGQVVLCTGTGLVVVSDPHGSTRTHICPDMALSLLSAVANPPSDVVPSAVAEGRIQPMPMRLEQGGEPPWPAARGPPSDEISELKPV